MRARAGRPPSGTDTTRDRIIDAALETFALRGFKGATTKEIAKRARVNEVTVFRLFKTKKALYATAVRERAPIIEIKKSISLDSRKSVEAVLFDNIKTVLGILRANRNLYMVMLGDVWRQGRSRTNPLTHPLDEATDFVSGLLKAQMDMGKMREADPRLSARVLMGAIQFYFMSTDVLGKDQPSESGEDRAINAMVDLFINGMGARSGSG